MVRLSGPNISMEGWAPTCRQILPSRMQRVSPPIYVFFPCLSHKPGVIMGTHQTRELIGGLKHVVFLKEMGWGSRMKLLFCSGECRTWSQKPSESMWTQAKHHDLIVNGSCRTGNHEKLRPFIPIFMTYVDLWVANVFEYVTVLRCWWKTSTLFAPSLMTYTTHIPIVAKNGFLQLQVGLSENRVYSQWNNHFS